MDKSIFYIKTNGCIFLDHRDKAHRTPVRLLIDKNQISMYESLIKRIPYAEYSIEEPTENDLIPKKQSKLSIIKPQTGINFDLKMKG